MVRAPPRLLLLGAGPETRALLHLTSMFGWQVELIEHRARWLRFAEACAIDRIHREGPAALRALLAGSRFDAALVMNHHFDLDARGLTELAHSDIAWLGLLGPAARRDAVLEDIGSESASLLQDRLHAPVGLDLGGEGAQTIALSIVAQLQTEFSRRACG